MDCEQCLEVKEIIMSELREKEKEITAQEE